MALPAINKKALASHLQADGKRPLSVDNEGNVLTYEAVMSRQMWDEAVGYKEEVRDVEGNVKEIVHKPNAAVRRDILAYNIGKPGLAVADERQGIKASDQVAQLSRDRLNKMAAKAMHKTPSPPKYIPPTAKD